MAFVSGLTDPLNRVLEPVLRPVTASLSTPLGTALLTLFIIAYAGKVRLPLPQAIASLFDSAPFRILVLSLIGYTANRNAGLSVFVAIAFVASVNMFSGRSAFETFSDAYAVTSVPPGCLNIKVFDLIAAYNNDKDALVNAMIQARVPANVPITDDYAPIIATHLLVNMGKQITSMCAPPS
jgi:hypothetical protein